MQLVVIILQNGFISKSSKISKYFLCSRFISHDMPYESAIFESPPTIICYFHTIMLVKIKIVHNIISNYFTKSYPYLFLWIQSNIFGSLDGTLMAKDNFACDEYSY